jgi:hypothetical protein
MVRYRIRRECSDVRYEWLSPIRYWNQQKPRIEMVDAHRDVDRFELLVTDTAPGPVELRVYDLQGRVVSKTRHEVADDRITIRFDEARTTLRSGLYFALVEDSLGQRSDAIRVVIVR